MRTPKGMDPAYYKFIYVPVMALIGIFVASEVIKAFIPNTFFRYIVLGCGFIGALGTYYKDQLKSFV